MKDTSWNALYIRSDTIVDYIASKYNMKKSDILNVQEGNMAVRLALGETEVIDETKVFLKDQGIDMEELDVFFILINIFIESISWCKNQSFKYNIIS